MTLTLGKQVMALTDALAYLHENDIVHGDVKADNILVAGDCTPKLSDFGLAKISGADPSRSGRGNAGTLLHLSPERLGGNALARTKESDVYAYGITIYEVSPQPLLPFQRLLILDVPPQIISGRVPLGELRSYGEIVFAVCQGNMRPPTEPVASSTGESYVVAWVVARESWATQPERRITMKRAQSVIRDLRSYRKPYYAWNTRLGSRRLFFLIAKEPPSKFNGTTR